MSEQFALQPEEIESTTERLESILDRLNSLGASAAKMKVAPLRPLQSVPEDSTSADVELHETDQSQETVESQETNQSQEMVEPQEENDPSLTPPGVPTLGLVPPLEDHESASVQLRDETPVVLEPTVAVEQPSQLEAIELADPIESVQAIPLEQVEAEQVEPEQVAIEQAELEQVEVEQVETEQVEAESAGFEPVEFTTVEFETVEFETVEFDSAGFDSVEIDSAQVEEAIEEPEFAPPALEIVEPATSTAVPEAPAPEAEAQAPVAPVVAAPIVATPIVETPAVEFHDLELTADVGMPVPEATIAAPVETHQVFEMDLPDEVPPAPVETPEAPTSIFGSSMGAATETVAEMPAAAPEVVATEEDDSATDGWVSHHEDASPVLSPPEVPATEAPAVSVPTFGGLPAPGTTVDESTLLEQTAPAVEAPMFFDQEAPAVEAPSFFDQEVSSNVAPVDPFDMAAEVEATLGELSADGGLDPFAALDATDESPNIAGIDTVVNIEAPIVDESNLYSTDEELPLPDFTGVYADTEASDPWADGAIPKSVENVPGLSKRRDELDKLRPSDDDGDEVMELVEPKRDLTIPVQFFLVIAFGIAVLVWYWLNDPEAVEDIRRSVDELRG